MLGDISRGDWIHDHTHSSKYNLTSNVLVSVTKYFLLLRIEIKIWKDQGYYKSCNWPWVSRQKFPVFRGIHVNTAQACMSRSQFITLWHFKTVHTGWVQQYELIKGTDKGMRDIHKRIRKSKSKLSWKEPSRIIESNSWTGVEHPKSHIMCWEYCPNPLTLSGLVLGPLPRGACSSVQPSLRWRTSFQYPV